MVYGCYYKFLIVKCLNINKRNIDGEFFFFYVVCIFFYEVFEFFLEVGVKCDVQDEKGNIVLMMGVIYGMEYV